jgi:hypothetical protein
MSVALQTKCAPFTHLAQEQFSCVTQNVGESVTLQVRTRETCYVEKEWTVFQACIH